VTVAGLLLAAGAGRRLGRAKALVEVGGTTLVQRGVSMLTSAGCAPVVVVVGAEAEAVRPHVAVDLVVADDWASGMGASLRAGLDALDRTSATACVVTLVDQPRLGAEAVRRVCAAAGESSAVVATYGGRPGHPVLLEQRIWREVADLAVGEVGARAWLRAHPEQVLFVDCDGTGSPADVDDAAQLAAVRTDPPPEMA
jgi:CTP:molybdopterin cytidylyltransferase MocA